LNASNPATEEIDVVVITAPKHWHAVQAAWACRHGKDITTIFSFPRIRPGRAGHISRRPM
jgi:hypothetical protein